jgi:PAS domain S-box-containing protein
MNKPLRALIVEDSEDDTLLLSRMLKREGYDITIERVDTSDAMKAALGRQTWDAIICDYVMPHFSAPAALGLLKESRLDIPFIVVSGVIGEDTAVEMMKTGAHDYIMKDNLTRLAPAIERELREAGVRRERRRMEDSLRRSEERYRRLVESVTDYIYTVRVENGRLVKTTHGPGCVSVTGYTSEEYEADPFLWYRMVHEGDRDAVIEQANRILSGEVVKPIEHRITHKDGSIRWVRNTPVPRHDEHGRLVAYDGLVSDITERKHLEEQLMQVQKMDAIGRLAGGIAHDFNNFLTAIIGYGNVLRMKTREDDPLRGYINQILALSEKAANLTQSLLAFSRKQIMNPRLINLNDIVKGIEKLLMRFIGEDIKLETSFYEGELTVMADPGQLEQVLINLATNARDAMPDGGSLTIKTEPVRVDEEYAKHHLFERIGMYALISVADTGTGMDEKTKEKIFEPFFTTKELGKGTGLGLSIVFGIIKQHNGYIDVHSESNKGTTFKIYLPLMVSEVEKAPRLVEQKPFHQMNLKE